ncbi:MAG: winged helix-turn-helix domain-containing protein, partial [Actinomycetota bacterium]|nr:winged helix-turn-helix domain-containing protein [Actinomycetota bacterium]
MTTEVAVRILGPLEVEVSGRPVSLRSPSQRKLLLRLVVDAGRPVSVDSLAEALWGDEPPTDPMSALRFHVSKLRKALTESGLIETTDSGYQLAIDPESVDAHQFDRLVTSATASSDARRTLDLTEKAL